MAPWLGPVAVTVRAPPPGVVAAVVDIGSRHAPVAVAAERAIAAAATPARRRAHKIDSLLRGNWAHELVAVQRGVGRPGAARRGAALGSAGSAGAAWSTSMASRSAVTTRGVPPRPRARPSTSWMPGRRDVVELADATAVRRWSAEGGSFAVCDASSDEDLDAIAAVWRETDLVLAGTAGSIAAAVASTAVARVDGVPMTLAGDVLVVCGSLHPTARAQIDALRSVAGVTVLASPPADRAVRRPDGCRAGGRRARRGGPRPAGRHGRSGCSSSSAATRRRPSSGTSRWSSAARWRRACRGRSAPTAAARW